MTDTATIVIARMAKKEREHLRILAAGDLAATADIPRPVTRADCERAERPCPYVSCRYHLYLDVQSNGDIKLNFPGQEPEEFAVSCVLDVADEGGAALDRCAGLLSVSMQRIQQILGRAIQKVGPTLRIMFPKEEGV